MKIVCDSCSAKYSIADEKVAGKVFKIRCKKCSSVIVVRGDQVSTSEAPPAEAAAPAADPGTVWHVVVDGDQQGPFSPDQLGEMLSAGTMDWESYVWREGFDNWLTAKDVPELVDAISGGATKMEPAPTAPAAAADPFAAGGESPFSGGAAESGPPEGGGLFGGGGGGADLFAPSESSASPFEGGAPEEDVVASAPGPRVDAEQAMTGQRNENSVLFSLQNLQALATGSDSDSSAGTAPAPVAATSKPGHASGEGSGLIDIRALAATTGVSGGEGGSSAGQKERVDDLLSIGTGSPLGSSLGAPVLAAPVEEKNNKGLLFAIIGAAAIVTLGLVGVAAMFIMSSPDPMAQAGTPSPITAPAAAAPTDPSPAIPPTGGDEPSQPANDEGASAPVEEEAEASAGSGDSEPTNRRERDRERERRERDRRQDREQSAAAATEMAPEPAPAMTARTSMGNRDIDSLINQVVGGGGSMTAAAPAMTGGGGNLPDVPARDAVARALRSVSGAVRACGNGQHGVANTTVVISGSNGRVQSARVAGQFAGTPVGSCVARAVRGAQFPRFSRPSFSVTFPYSL